MKITELKTLLGRLINLSNLNIIMGRNGAGKSRFLRSIEHAYRGNKDFYIRYVSPERAGSFKRDGNIITNMSNSPTWLMDVRSVNQASDFKAASAVLLREAEMLYLRRLANTPEIRNDPTRNFKSDRLDKINGLLTNISLEMGPLDFEFRTFDGKAISPIEISSGESEAVSLAAEILYFFDTIDVNRFNVLLLDEPDVHLHPDMQARLAKFIIDMLDEYKSVVDTISVCISTHSAPFVCAVAASEYTSVGTKSFGVEDVVLKAASDELKKIAPFFGHPLSLTLSEDAALILEGEDDERVWRQAARSSNGRIKLFPVLATSVHQQSDLEKFCIQLLTALYDNSIAFSLRDGDGVKNVPLEHTLPLRRYRLNCYAIENVLVTDQCLSVMGISWDDFAAKTDAWLLENADHKDVGVMRELRNASNRLRHKKIKNIRQLICSVAGIGKPWEVVAGQALGAIEHGASADKNMLVDFVGENAVKALIFREF